MRLLIPLFSPATGTWGGLTRVMAISNAAQQAGHSVAFCASGYLEQTLRERGFQVYSNPPTTMFGLPGPISRIIERRSQHATLPVKPGKSVGSIWLVLMMSGLARSDYLYKLVQAEQQAVKDFHADALFTDLDPGAFILARLANLPIASAYQTVETQGTGSFAWHQMNHAVNAVLQANRCSPQPIDSLFFGPDVLKIIPSIPALDGEDSARSDVRYVGHLLGDIKAACPDDFVPEPGKRYIFVYVGTGAVSLDTIRRELPKVITEEGPLRAVVGAQTLTGVERLGGVELRPYVSDRTILPYCDWTICHGGQNTIIQSLLHGVPLMVFPGPIFERRFNAQKVEDAGVGLMGESNQFEAGWLEQALRRQPEFEQKAVVLGASIKAYGGAPTAIKAIEENFYRRIKR